MHTTGETSQAWQPLTPHGVAAFASASLRRLLVADVIFAVMLSMTILWCLHITWLPVVHGAIRQLPATGEIRGGVLQSPFEHPELLAEGTFLAIAVDPTHSGSVRSPAHVQVQFGRTNLRMISLFGYSEVPYPGREWVVMFNRPELQPWWGAWQPPILWITAAVLTLAFVLIWMLIALCSFIPIWVVAFFANRELNLWQSWKMCQAAMLPGAAMLGIIVVGYGSGLIDLVQFLASAAAHIVVAWAYAVLGIFCRPKVQSDIPPRGNPFRQSRSE